MNDVDQVLEDIYDALDRQEPQAALELARDSLRAEGEDPVLRFLSGMALMELDLPEDAAGEFQKAVSLDPEDAEFRVNLALALFKSCRFPEATEHARQALEADPKFPDAHFVRALLLERSGDFGGADRHLAEAARIEPETFPAAARLTRKAFEAEAARAADRLPADFRRHLADVAVTIEDLPADEILLDSSPPLDPELLGLFVGVALPERTFTGPGGELPPRILLFQRNLERYACESDRVVEEITRTLYHELAHYLGFEEDQMEGMDLD